MEQAIAAPSAKMSEEEYLRFEEKAQTKHEYRDGQIIDMAGGTLAHALIATNLIGELRNRLQGKPCRVVGSDIRVRIQDKGHYFYPDVTVYCGTPVFDPPDRRTTLANPQVVIEVTSPGSENDDRTDKFYDYMRIPSLQEYILVSQERQRVETFYRQVDGIWAIGPYFSLPDDAVKFRTLGVEVPVSQIYADVEFPAAN